MEEKEFKELIEELNSLNSKVINLRTFISGEKSESLDNLNKDLLIGQLKAMETYLSILSIRIGLNTPSKNNE